MLKPMRSCAPSGKYPIRFPKLISRKLDGIRCAIDEGKAITKSGKPIPNKFIREWLEANVPDGLDGELLVGNPADEGVYGRTFSAVMSHAGEPEFSFHVFDLANEPDLDATERLSALAVMVNNLHLKQVVLVDQYLCHSQADVDRSYAQFIEEGYEGAILKDPAGPYIEGRSTPKNQIQLKLKPESDWEARIISVYEAETNNNEAYTNEVGETKRSTHAENKVGNGMCGGFIATDLTTGLQIRVAAGRLTHAERTEIWNNQASYVGKLAKYRSMSYGTMTNGQPRHGRWIGWRAEEDM